MLNTIGDLICQDEFVSESMSSSVFSECDIVANKVMQTVDGNVDLHEGCLCVGYINLFVSRKSINGTYARVQFNHQLDARGGRRNLDFHSQSDTSMTREFHPVMRQFRRRYLIVRWIFLSWFNDSDGMPSFISSRIPFLSSCLKWG